MPATFLQGTAIVASIAMSRVRRRPRAGGLSLVLQCVR
jgi:hypothetical protein